MPENSGGTCQLCAASVCFFFPLTFLLTEAFEDIRVLFFSPLLNPLARLFLSILGPEEKQLSLILPLI